MLDPSTINENGLKNFNVEKLSEILTKDYGEYSFIVEGLIPANGITILSGRPKSGKSWFVLYMVMQITAGNPLFEKMTTKQCKVLLIDEENSMRGIQRRAKKLGIAVDIPIINLQNFKIDKDEDRIWLKNYITDNQIELVVFDSFRRVHSKDENTSKDVAEIYDCLKDIMTTDVAVLVIHHNRKLGKFEKVDMESLRGSGDIGAMVDSFILIETEPLSEVNGNESTISMTLREDVSSKPFKVAWYDNEAGTEVLFEWAGEVIEKEKKIKMAKELCSNVIKDSQGITAKELIEVLKDQDIGMRNIREALKIMYNQGLIDSYNGEGRQHNTKFYIWRGKDNLETKSTP